MSANFTIDEKTGQAYAHIPLSSERASTFHSNRITLDKATAVAEIGTMMQDALDELEWHTIISTPHVKQALRRLAAEARRQIAAGETEEGGFAVE